MASLYKSFTWRLCSCKACLSWKLKQCYAILCLNSQNQSLLCCYNLPFFVLRKALLNQLHHRIGQKDSRTHHYIDEPHILNTDNDMDIESHRQQANSCPNLAPEPTPHHSQNNLNYNILQVTSRLPEKFKEKDLSLANVRYSLPSSYVERPDYNRSQSEPAYRCGTVLPSAPPADDILLEEVFEELGITETDPLNQLPQRRDSMASNESNSLNASK